MNLTLELIDAERCRDYVSNDNCFLATALKRQCQTNDVKVYPRRCVIDGVTYKIQKPLNDLAHDVHFAKEEEYSTPMPAFPQTFELEKLDEPDYQTN